MNEFLTGIIRGINGFVGNYGVAIILFTILVRLVLTPFDVKSRVGMRKMSQVQPKLTALQKKYANDKEKLNAKTAELYKKEKINPLSSCLPLLLTWPIIIAVFTAMRVVANEMLVEQIRGILDHTAVEMDPFLWIRNLWMPDSLFSSSLPDLNTMRQITGDVWISKFFTGEGASIPAALASLNLTTDSFATGNLNATVTAIYNIMVESGEYVDTNGVATAFAQCIGNMPGWSFNLLIAQIDLKQMWNGLMLLPILSAVSQVVMTKVSGTNQAGAAPADPSKPNTGKMMTWFFPLFSLMICFGYSSAFALYWVSGNLVSMAQTLIINKVLDNKEKKTAALQGEGSIK